MRTSLLTSAVLSVSLFSCGVGLEPDPPHAKPQPITSCDGLSRAACGARADCAVQELFCAAVCLDDGQGGCVPCDAFECVSAAPTTCEALDEATCSARADCRLEHLACALLCEDDGTGSCAPCNAAPRCVTLPPTSPCEGLEVDACGATPGCGVVTMACRECRPNELCAPCEEASVCVPMEPPSACFSLDVATCTTHPECELAPGACPAVCEDDGHGGCLPCDAPPSCQPVSRPPVAGCGSGGSQPPHP